MLYNTTFYTRSLIALSMMALFVSCGSPDLNPKYGLSHVAFEIPVRALSSENAYQMRFSVTHESLRYRLFLAFDNADADSLEQQASLVRRCITDGEVCIRSGAEVIRSETFNKETGFAIIGNERLSTFMASDLKMEAGREYEIDLQMPRFSDECQELEPFLLMGIAPPRDL